MEDTNNIQSTSHGKTYKQDIKMSFLN